MEEEFEVGDYVIIKIGTLHRGKKRKNNCKALGRRRSLRLKGKIKKNRLIRSVFSF